MLERPPGTAGTARCLDPNVRGLGLAGCSRPWRALSSLSKCRRTSRAQRDPAEYSFILAGSALAQEADVHEGSGSAHSGYEEARR